MKKHSKLCAIFLTALLSISAVSFSVSAVGEEVDPGGDSSVIVDPVEPEPEPEPEPSPEPSPEPEPEPQPQPDPVYPDSSDSSSYVDPGYSSSDSSYDNNYNYDSSYDYNNNSYDNNYSSSQTYYYSEPSYVGGGQSYVAPSNTAPSASLIKSDDNIDEKTLSSNDWSDIAKILKIPTHRVLTVMTLTSSRTITARVTTVIGCSMFHSFYSHSVLQALRTL